MLLIVCRFVVGGLLVAGVPLVARRFGAEAAGLLMMVPVVTFVSLAMVAADLGVEGSAGAARAGLWGLLAIAASLVVYGWIVHRVPVGPALLAGVSVWVGVAAAVLHAGP